jgi:hypothetical protein
MTCVQKLPKQLQPMLADPTDAPSTMPDEILQNHELLQSSSSSELPAW